MTIRLHKLAPLALLTLLACDTQPSQPVVGLQAHSFKNSEWSVPENLGAPVNSPFQDQAPALSKDGLRLYFASDRPGGVGGIDLWVSRRACEECPWEEPLNLGPVINSILNDNGTELSPDGHLLFFQSPRPGGQGLNDIYVSRRSDPKDDLGWGPPVNVGPDVNTAAFEAGPFYLQSAEDGSANLYFNKGPGVSAQDIYYAPMTRDGETRGPAVLVAELSDPTANDANSAVRADGREMFFHSDRIGTLGFADLWTSTRRSVHEAWSPPENLGAPVNTPFFDQQAGLSHDGRVLVFVSNRPGGVGGLDIWMSTRTPSGH